MITLLYRYKNSYTLIIRWFLFTSVLLITLGFNSTFLAKANAQAFKPGSEYCEALLRDVPSQSFVDPNEDVIVTILSEAIAPGSSNNYSCSQIVNCLRERDYGSTNANTESLVIAELKNKYAYCVISGRDGLDLLTNYISTIYQYVSAIIGAVAVLIIIMSGIQMSVSGISQEDVSEAKDRIIRALVGLVVLFLSAVILYTINPFFFQ